ncbi:MAG: selenide, water dikinase SelD [Eubacteriales bacterium]|nr:selenide, water dikinase SelD [Eubacteriales bacterium]
MSDVKLTKLAKCAGCGAKVGAGMLQKLLGDLPVKNDPALLVGFERSDDASVYRISDELAIVQTIDFFPPVVDDPVRFGRIAAANALSDIYAMGGEPKVAQNVLMISKAMPDEMVHGILRGGYEKVMEAGAVISGGHSIHGEEPVYGLAVTGFVHPDRVLTNSGAQDGDALILTKPLGVGIYLTAAKAEMLEDEELAQALDQMERLNKAEAMLAFDVHACTDVTGFSLLGHAVEMAEGSQKTLELTASAIPMLPKALELASMGLLPEGMYRNRNFAEAHVELGNVALAFSDVLFDPQTSGGLLIAVAQQDCDALISQLQETCCCAVCIGQVKAQGEKAVILR